MKLYQLIFILFLPIFSLSAQFTNNGATVKIQSGAILYVDGDVENTNGGTIDNTGTIELTGDLTNSATLNSDSGSKISFSGSNNSSIQSGGAVLQNLDMKKTAADLILGQTLDYLGILNFVNDDNQVILNNLDLTVGPSGSINNFTNNKYIITGGTGKLVKKNLNSSFTFPLGYDDLTYNPVILTEAGTADTLGVRVEENVLQHGNTGPILDKKVSNATWVISEDNIGGSNLTVDLFWASSDQASGFDPLDCGVSRYNTDHWDLTLSNVGAAAGSNPYNISRSGIQNVGIFSVGSEPVMDSVRFIPQVFLEGPFNGTDMNDNLRNFGYVPVEEPYTVLGYSHEGRGGGEMVTDSATVFGVTGNNAIVDWVFLEVRDKNDATIILGTRSALIQSDGDIVDVNGVSPVTFNGFAPDTYFVAVRHRLHLGFRSSSTQSLSRTLSNISFIDGTVSTFGTDALKNISDEYAMYSGNANYDTTVNAVDKNNLWRVQNGTTYVYLTSTADFDLNAVINAVDKNNHWRVNNGTIEQLD